VATAAINRYSGGARAPSAPSAPRRATIRKAASLTISRPEGVRPRGITGDRVTPKPAPAAATPAATAQPSSPDPRDASYWAQRSKLLSQEQTDLAKAQQQQSYEDTDFAEALRRRAVQHDKDTQQIREGANREGLLFSGQLGKRQGDYEVGYQQQNADTQQAYERAKAERAPTIEALRSALQSGVPLEEAAIYAEAVDRQLQRDSNNPPNPYEGIDFDALSRLIAAQKKPAAKAKSKPKAKSNVRNNDRIR
jgi:hypothetical protein